MILTMNHSVQSQNTMTGVARGLWFRSDTYVSCMPYVRLDTVAPRSAPRTFADEKAAFADLLPFLIARHPGEYVAVSGGNVVEHGPSRAVVTRQYFQGGRRGPVYIGFAGPKRTARQLSPFRSRRNARVR